MVRNQPQQTQQGEKASILLLAISLTPVPGTRGTYKQPMASRLSMATQGNHSATYSSQTQDMGLRSLYCCCPWGLTRDCCDSTRFMSTSNQQGQAGNMSFGGVGVGRGGPSQSYGVSLFVNTQGLSVLSKSSSQLAGSAQITTYQRAEQPGETLLIDVTERRYQDQPRFFGDIRTFMHI